MVTMSAVWDRTTEFLSDNLGAVVPIALAAIFLPASIQGNLQPLAATAAQPLRVGLGLFGLLLSLVSMWGQLVLVAMVVAPGESATALATRRLPVVIGVSIALLAGFALLALPLIAILAGYGFAFADVMAGQRPKFPDGAGGPIALYIVVLLPVVLWLAARLALTSPVVAAERRGLGAIARSFALTRGLALRIVGVILLFAIVAWIATLAAQTVFGSILQLVAGGDGPISLATILTAIIVSVVSTGFSVIASVFVAKLYLAARAERPDPGTSHPA